MNIVNWILFFLYSWGLPFTIYLILQIGSILNLRGTKRKIAMVPIPAMILVVVATIVGYQQESNLWPIYLIFISPFAALFVGLIWLVDFLSKKRKGE